MSAEHVKVVLEPQSFGRAMSGGITGTIWLAHGHRDEGSTAFPERGWSDFPVVLLEWWLRALTRTRAGEARCAFMDGPYDFIVTGAGETLLRVRCCERRQNSEVVVAEFVTRTVTLLSSVRGAAADALAECDRRGWTGSDIEKLRSALVPSA